MIKSAKYTIAQQPQAVEEIVSPARFYVDKYGQLLPMLKAFEKARNDQLVDKIKHSLLNYDTSHMLHHMVSGGIPDRQYLNSQLLQLHAASCLPDGTPNIINFVITKDELILSSIHTFAEAKHQWKRLDWLLCKQ